MTLLEYVKRIFDDPTMDDGLADAIIWGCTGFPCFWVYDPPMKCFTDQLRHAKRALARGYTIDQIFEGKDRCRKAGGTCTV